MIHVGQFNNLKVIRTVDFGVYLEDEAEGILLPKRFVPAGTKMGDVIKAFIYHDGEGRLIATTQEPKGVVGDRVYAFVNDESNRTAVGRKWAENFLSFAIASHPHPKYKQSAVETFSTSQEITCIFPYLQG